MVLGGLSPSAEQNPPPKAGEEATQADQRGAEATPLFVKLVARKPTAQEAKDNERDRKERAEVETRALIVNVALIFLGIAQVVVTSITLFGLRHSKNAADAAKEAADAGLASVQSLKKIERGYVFLSIDDVVYSAEPPGIKFSIGVNNIGKTPSILKVFYYKLYLVEPSATEPFIEADGVYKVADYVLSPNIPQPLTHAAWLGPGPCYFFGFAIFEDIFRETHYSRFCCKLDRNDQGHFVAGPPSWNHWD